MSRSLLESANPVGFANHAKGFRPLARITAYHVVAMRPSPDSLSSLLRRADPAAAAASPDPVAFAAAVHARIRGVDTAWRGRSVAPAARFAFALGRHLFPLAAALAVLASIGAGSAVAYARERDARVDAYADAYVRSIDPWQMHGSGADDGESSHGQARAQP